MSDLPNTSEGAAYDRTLLDLAILLLTNVRLLLSLPLIAGALALAIAFLIPPTYTAICRVLPPLQQGNAMLAAQLGAIASLIGTSSPAKTTADQYVAFLKSRTIYDAIVERFALKKVYGVRLNDDARKELDRRTRITAGVRDSVISIEVEDSDPARGAEIANAFVEELRHLSKHLAITEAAQRRMFFDKQLQETRQQLHASEVALRGSGVNDAALKTMPQASLEALARLKAQVTSQQIRLASMRTFMTESNPEFKVALQELLALQSELRRAEQNSTANVAGGASEYFTKYRDFKYHEALYELVAKQYELARLDEAREGSVIQVLDTAKPSEKPSRPRKLLITILSALLGLLVSVSWILVVNRYRKLAQHPDGVQKLATLRALLKGSQS